MVHILKFIALIIVGVGSFIALRTYVPDLGNLGAGILVVVIMSIAMSAIQRR